MTGDELRTVFSKKIKFFRNSRGWSQADLAEKADISITFLSDIERGNKWPHPDTLTSLARALDIDVYKLFIAQEPVSDDVKEAVLQFAQDISITFIQSLDRVTKRHLDDQSESPYVFPKK
jgi:transcriptional regulator with XRE-family HTH domain